jgi:hypothetical protein
MFKRMFLLSLFSISILCAQAPDWKYFNQLQLPISSIDADFKIAVDSLNNIWAISNKDIIKLENSTWISFDSSFQSSDSLYDTYSLRDIVFDRNNHAIVALQTNTYGGGSIYDYDGYVWSKNKIPNNVYVPQKILIDKENNFYLVFINWWAHQTGFDRVGKYGSSNWELLSIDYLNDIIVSDSLLFTLGYGKDENDNQERGVFAFSKTGWLTEYEAGKLICKLPDSLFSGLSFISKVKNEIIVCGDRFYTVKDSVLLENAEINSFLTSHQTSITSINIENDSIIWLGTDGGYVLSYCNGVLTGYDFLRNLKTISKKITDIEFDRDGNKWLGVNGVGIVEFNEDKIVGINNNIDEQLPDAMQLFQNYPNPFNPSTSINIYLSGKTDIKLSVYDILGRELKTIASGEYEKGYHTFKFFAERFASGMYFYNLQGKGISIVRKMLLLK